MGWEQGAGTKKTKKTKKQKKRQKTWTSSANAYKLQPFRMSHAKGDW